MTHFGQFEIDVGQNVGKFKYICYKILIIEVYFMWLLNFVYYVNQSESQFIKIKIKLLVCLISLN